MRTETFQRGFLLVLVAGVSVYFWWMIRDFVVTLLFAALFTGLMYPLYLRFLDLTRQRRHLSSLLTLLVFVLVVVLPVAGFVTIVAKQAVHVAESVKPWMEANLGDRQEISHSLQRLPGYKHLAAYREPILERVSGLVGGLGNLIFQKVSALTGRAVVLLLNFAIMVYAMFFFFVDGPGMLKKILYYMPLEHRDERRLLNGFLSMTRATIKGVVVIGLVQGSLAGLAFWLAGIPSVIFWVAIMAVLSILPNVGSALVWGPACIYLFMRGETTPGVLVLLWCSVVVASADNVLRPVLVGKDTQMHELLILISTLGGLAVMGLEGFILGPVIAVLFLTVWDIYGAAFKDVLPKE